MVRISCEGITIDRLRLPPFQLTCGELICLHLPCRGNSKEELHVVRLLTGEMSARGLSIFGRILFADPPEFRAGLLSIFRRPRVGDWLRNKAGISLAQANTIAKALGLEANEQICRLEGSPRVRLGLEAAWARGAEAIVFSTLGCERLPLQEAVLSRIDQCPAIYLSYPFWTQGQRKRECHPRARCIQVTQIQAVSGSRKSA
jgi:hypothetical protein